MIYIYIYKINYLHQELDIMKYTLKAGARDDYIGHLFSINR